MAEQHTDQKQAARQEKRVVSMHEGVEVWQDCCCCEAEPYWIEAMAQDEPEQKAQQER